MTVALGVAIDITERKEAEEHIKLLMNEITHRAKNLLTVVQAVARQTASEVDPARFVERFGHRATSPTSPTASAFHIVPTGLAVTPADRTWPAPQAGRSGE